MEFPNSSSPGCQQRSKEPSEDPLKWRNNNESEALVLSVLAIYGISLGLGVFWALEAQGRNGNKPVENQIR